MKMKKKLQKENFYTLSLHKLTNIRWGYFILFYLKPKNIENKTKQVLCHKVKVSTLLHPERPLRGRVSLESPHICFISATKSFLFQLSSKYYKYQSELVEIIIK